MTHHLDITVRTCPQLAHTVRYLFWARLRHDTPSNLTEIQPFEGDEETINTEPVGWFGHIPAAYFSQFSFGRNYNGPEPEVRFNSSAVP